MPEGLRFWLLLLAIGVWAALQYGLAYWTLRDLARRPKVRGGNKVLWAIVILVVPIAGALFYASVGPTSFLPRPGRPLPPRAATETETERADPPA